MSDKLITLMEAADRIGISKPQAESLAESGQLASAVEVDGDWWVDEEDVIFNTGHRNPGKSSSLDSAQLIQMSTAANHGAEAIKKRDKRVRSSLANFKSSRYDDLGLLGAGGMGEVRRVRDKHLGRVVALKTILTSSLTRPESAARFMEEAQATAQLQHPGIIPIYDLGRFPDGRLWFTMKEVSGRTFGEVIDEVHKVSTLRWETTPSGWNLRRLLDALRQVCDAVSYAHSRGVIHRDLKPDNVMLGPHGEVLVLDWGLTKLIEQEELQRGRKRPDSVQTQRTHNKEQLTQFGGIMGTPAYMSPEQAEGRAADLNAQTDIYSLGAMLYNILSGRVPYSGENANVVLEMVRNGPPTPLSAKDHVWARAKTNPSPWTTPDEENRPLPSALVNICERAMARRPEGRYLTATDLASELQDWLNGAKRRDEALSVVAQAEARTTVAADLQTQAKVLRTKATELLNDIEPWQPETDKIAGWSLQEEAAALERQAEMVALEEERLVHASLIHAPDLAEAHANLAARYRIAHRIAESNRENTVRVEALLRQHLEALSTDHPAHALHSNYLKGDGTLSLTTNPAGAEVILCQYVEQNRRLVPKFERSLGHTPLEKVSLPMGSYLCILKHPERTEVRYPVLIERQQHWDGLPPDGHTAYPIHLPLPTALGPNDCYIAGGWFWSGGDQSAPNALPRRRLWVDDFIIRRHPVTNAQYLEFLDSLVAMDREEEALRYAPRERAGFAGLQEGALIFGFDGRNFSLEPDVDGDVWEPDVPVLMVDWHGAAAFAAWEAERTGEPWTLPAELAWEKAARGVDGRAFPWGDHFDPSRACMRESHAGRLLPASVEAYPLDESPYGVRGMAGNAADWCADTRRDGPLLKTARVAPTLADLTAESEVRVTRGGGWYSELDHLRLADRYWNHPLSRTVSLGFRLARPVSW